MTSDVSMNHSPTDNVPVTDNQCYGSVIVGSSVQHHVTVSSGGSRGGQGGALPP